MKKSTFAIRCMVQPGIFFYSFKAGLPIVLCFNVNLTAIAQTIAQPKQGDRLSAWILRQPQNSNSYLTGLSWNVAREKATQEVAKTSILSHLVGSTSTIEADPQARQRLSDWIAALAVTGRVRVEVADARWLEANAALDPVLSADDEVVVPTRPSSVTVITSNGYLCQLAHAPGQEARYYVSACQSPTSKDPIEKVWVAQPDGYVKAFNNASWNGQVQDEPAPGAWIWAPAVKGGWSEQFSQQLIEFVATQGPSGKQITQNTLRPDPSATSIPLKLPKQRDPAVIGNDWGGIGLLQTPTARMAEAGNLAVGFVRSYPYSQLNFSLQPFDWAELNYRYTSVSGVLYGPATLSGNQSYKDKSIDLKIQVLKESQYLPEVAIGARDLVGTGLFSGEYVVANKRFADIDLSLGVGWGALGGRATLGTPLGLLSNKFKTRSTFAGQGGQVGALNFFRGPAAIFGGVQWQTPIDSLVLKAEYDGNNFQYPAPFNLAPPKSAFNFGAAYRYSPAIDVTFSLQRGNVAALGVAFHYPMGQLATPKTADPLLPRFTPDRPAATEPASWPNTANDVSAHTGWRVAEIVQAGRVMQVTLENPIAIYWLEAVSRATAVLHHQAPPDIEEFHFIYKTRDSAMATHVVNRAKWIKSKSQPLTPRDLADEGTEAVKLSLEPPVADAVKPAVGLYRASPKNWNTDFGFGFKQSLGGPDTFLLYQLSLEATSELKLSPNTWVSNTFALRAIDNYKNFRYTAPSNLPRVRTLVREFSTSSRVTMPNLQVTHMEELAKNQYYSVYGGYLENMYAGIGGEWLYRPLASPVALGIDINAVRQRDFDQMFKLRDYGALTGHITAYVNTGWKDVLVKVSAGQYLAKDKGVTVELNRTFKNGVSFGVYATKTNVSAAQFGEGSFDKGIYFAVPFSAMFTKSVPDVAVFNFSPLIRDGGAKLNRAHTLFDMTRVRDSALLTFEPPKSR